MQVRELGVQRMLTLGIVWRGVRDTGSTGHVRTEGRAYVRAGKSRASGKNMR